MQHHPLNALCDAFELLTDRDGEPLKGTYRVCMNERQYENEKQIVLRVAGGRWHDELEQFNPYSVQFTVYDTDADAAFNQAHLIGDGYREKRSVGGEEKWQDLNGWIIRDVHTDVPYLLESISITNMDNTLYGVSVLVHFVLMKAR